MRKAGQGDSPKQGFREKPPYAAAERGYVEVLAGIAGQKAAALTPQAENFSAGVTDS